MALLMQTTSAMLTAPSNTNGSRKQRLLVGEKNPTVRSFLLSVFSAQDYDVVGVADGTDLLDAVSVSLHPEYGSGAFALVISDTSLLHREELQVFDRLAEWTRLPPFIFITGFRAGLSPAMLATFETVAVLEQPLDIADLRNRVNSFLRHPPRDDHGRQSAAHG